MNNKWCTIFLHLLELFRTYNTYFEKGVSIIRIFAIFKLYNVVMIMCAMFLPKSYLSHISDKYSHINSTVVIWARIVVLTTVLGPLC